MRNYKQRKVKKKKFEYGKRKKPSIIPRVALLLSVLSLIILFIKGLINYQPENDQSWQLLLRHWKWIAFVIFLILLVPIIMWLINRTAKRFKTD